MGRVGKLLLVTTMLAACGGAPRRSSTTTRTTTPPGLTQPGVQHGLATWYGDEQHGGPTASGERFNKNKMTAAHRKLRFGTRVRVTNKKNGRSVEVRINDRGPYGSSRRIIDVSEAAARRLGMIDAGVVPVIVEVLR
jgi:rare lipoprotein A